MRPAAAFVLEGVYQDRVFACHGLLARDLGDAFGIIDAHSMQVALFLRECIQDCSNDAKGATKAPLRSSYIDKMSSLHARKRRWPQQP